MRQSSSASEPVGLFDEVYARGPVRAALSDTAWRDALLDVEASLARSLAAVGLIPGPHAQAIVATCQDRQRYDVSALARALPASGTPVLAVVQALRAAVGPDLAPSVHKGATSQDVLDSAAMLLARRAIEEILTDLAGAARAAATLAETHRDTVMAGRTLLQQAVPVTFGLKAAGWMSMLDGAADRLAEVRDRRLAAQLAGAAGTLHDYGAAGPELVRRFAAELGLPAPELPWHTDRTRIADLAGAAGTTAGVLGKVARDLTLLAQTEVAEVAEAAPGASSAMPHKRNPVAAVATLACTAQAPGLVATLLAAMTQEHERAAGGWQAEWLPLRGLLTTVGSAASWLRAGLTGLEVDRAALAANLARTPAVDGPGAAGDLVDRALAAHRGR